MKTDFKKTNKAKRTVSDFSYGKKKIVFYNDAIKQDENIKHNLNHIGAGLSGIVNFVRKFNWSSVDWKKIVPAIPFPMVPIYSHF